MNILETLVQLRDDLKTWVTNNLNALNKKIDEKTIPIDSELSATSTNPVQNKVINTEINSLNNLIGDTSVATQISTAIANQDLFSGDYNDLQNAPNISEDEENKELIIADKNDNVIAKIDANGLKTTKVTANNVNINGTDISEDISGKVEFADGNGNVIVQINDAGIKSIDFYVGDISLKEKIHMWDSKSGFSGDYYDLYNKPSISEYKLDEFIITDFEGNIIGKFDKNGLQTTTIFSEKIFLQNNNLLNQITDLYKRMDSINYDNLKNTPPITSVQEQKLRVVDEQGNIVCLIDADGVTTTKINTDELILSSTSMDAEFADFNLRLENFDKRIDNFTNSVSTTIGEKFTEFSEEMNSHESTVTSKINNFQTKLTNFQTKLTNFENSINLTKVTYSTTDLVAGSSSLPTGELYIVYE